MTASSPIRVLLVEDDAAHAAMIGTELAASNTPVALEHASTLADAIARLSCTLVDAILLDLALPDSNGLDTLDRLYGVAGAVPILVLTAHDGAGLALQAVQRGAEDCLLKGDTNGRLLVRAIRYARARAGVRLQLLEREGRLRQAQKMEALGKLAGGVAHDFNNVLTTIFGYSDLLRDELPEGDLRRADLDEIRLSAERAGSLTRQLLAFSRKQLMQPRVLNLNDVVANVEKPLAVLTGDDVPIDFRPAGGLWQVKADPGQLEQVLMNLAANARDAMPEGGHLVIATGNATLGADDVRELPDLTPGEYVKLTVIDTGMGMPESVRQSIFEPFFTTTATGQGAGLRLATVYGIIKQTGGGIFVQSEEGKGTRFDIFLPRVP